MIERAQFLLRRHPKESVPKVAVTGVDGVGKSTATWHALEALAKENQLKIVKPNPPAELITPAGRINQYIGLYRLVDRLHGLADRRRSRTSILIVNSLRVALQGRIVEPGLVRRHRPDLIVTTRDLITDSAVYQVFYTPRQLLRPIPERIARAKRVSGTAYRDLILFLTVDPQEAMRRIEKRIEEEKAKAPEITRAHWLHMHENQKAILLLQAEYYQVIPYVRRQNPTRIIEVDTLEYSREEVSNIIAQEVRAYLDGAREPQWLHYPQVDNNIKSR